jgi:hypothetical protein
LIALDSRARTYRITIYRDDADPVGVDVSDMVSEEGLALQRSPVQLEAPVSCTAEFTLLADSNSGGDLDPDTSTYIRPGARVHFEYRNDAGVWVEVPWGARQVLAFATADRPDSIDPGQPWKPWSVQVQCQQTLKQQQWIESTFDPQYGAKERLGTYSTLDDLAIGICQAKSLEFSPQSGDPDPAISYNDRVYYDPRTADSALAFLHKIAALNPNVGGKEYGAWQDNQGRVRWFEANLTTARVQASSVAGQSTLSGELSDLLFNSRWELYSNDLIAFKPINQTRQQMPGILRVSAIARYAEFKTNPLVSFTRNGDQTLEAFDYNNWVYAERFIKTTTRVPTNQVKEGETGTIALDRTEITKEYDLLSDRRLSKVTTRRFGPQHLADDSGTLAIIELTKEIKDYAYNYDGTLNHVRTQLFAIPKLVQADAEIGQELVLAPAANSITAHNSGGGFEYSKYRSTAQNLQRQSDLYAYAPVSNANTASSRPEPSESQEEVYMDVQKPIHRDRVLLYNRVAISKRVKTVDVGAMVFNGARLNQLAENLAYRESGSYSQYEIKFPLTDAIAANWERPGRGLGVYDWLTNQTKIFGSFGGETIVFGKDSVDCLINAEYLGTVENGNLVTAAEVERITLDNQSRITLDGQARIV